MQKVTRPQFKNKKEPRKLGLFKRKDSNQNQKQSIVAQRQKNISKNSGIFSLLKREKNSKPSTLSDKYSGVANQRKKAIAKNRLRDIKVVLPIKSILLVSSIIILAVLLLVIRNSAFNVKEVQVIAPKEVIENIKGVMESYKGQNIYFITEKDVAAKIKEKVPEIERIYLYKQLPNRIEVEALQGDPVIIFANLEEISLFDANAVNIGSFGGVEKVGLSDYEQKLLKGERDLESDEVKNKYIEGKSDQEKLTIDWTKVPVEEKTNIVNGFVKSAEDKVVGYFNQIREVHSKSVYNSLPLIETYYINEIDVSDINSAIALIDGIESRGVRVSKNFLSTKFTLDLYSEDNKLVRLSLRRPVDSQIKEMDTIIYYGYFSAAKIIDLRSDTYSITR